MTLVVVLVGVSLVLLLCTRGPLAPFIGVWLGRGEERRMKDPLYALLRREIEEVAKQFEAMPYERLLEPDASLHQIKLVDGVEIHFDVETVHVKKNGDLLFCIDANAVGANTWRSWPSYQFYKRKDGSTYY